MYLIIQVHNVTKGDHKRTTEQLLHGSPKLKIGLSRLFSSGKLAICTEAPNTKSRVRDKISIPHKETGKKNLRASVSLLSHRNSSPGANLGTIGRRTISRSSLNPAVGPESGSGLRVANIVNKPKVDSKLLRFEFKFEISLIFDTNF